MNGDTNNRSRLIFVGVILAGAMIALIIILIGGEEEDGTETAALPSGCTAVDTPDPKDVQLEVPDAKPPADGTTATVETNCGAFTIDLATGEAPTTTSSFVFMAEQGVYENVAFTRIAPDFVIQGGDPTGTQAGNAGYTVTEAPPNDLKYTEGVVAMAKSGAEAPGTSGSQFFVVTGGATPDLPPEYALLGRVGTGMDVVQRIAGIGPISSADAHPKEPVVIESVTIDAP